MSYPRRIKQILQKLRPNKKGVALLMVITSMATLAIFIGEITYTTQINQKLAYDRLDQIKAHALAKSGLRIALLRIRAYVELKKMVSSATGNNSAAKAAANSMVPKAILEKIWSEPVTIPFTGDISALPSSIKDALGKFRKESGMEGKLYMAIEAQSSKFNINSILPSLAASPTPTPKTSPTPNDPNNPPAEPTPTPSPSASPDPNDQYSVEGARNLLLEHIKGIFAKKFEEDDKFKEQYRNYVIDDLVQDIIGWADLSYDTLRSQQAKIPFKQAPYYDLSELHYLSSMDDDVYDLISPQFTAGMSQGINVNMIKEAVLKGLVPEMTEEERKAFFEYRDVAPPEDNTFKTAEDFYKYLSEKVEAFKGVQSKIDDFKKNLVKRGISIITEELHFKVRIEATVNQTKRTMEALVTVIEPKTDRRSNNNNPNGQPTPTPTPTNAGIATEQPDSTSERSSLKITQIRFL